MVLFIHVLVKFIGGEFSS